MCKEHGRFVAATFVHHIKPLGDGGTYDESNLMSLSLAVTRKFIGEAEKDKSQLKKNRLEEIRVRTCAGSG